jgi:hypothetical protein
MPNVVGMLRANSAYAFLAVGVVWLAVAVLAGSALVLWPVVACFVSGYALKMMPGHRFTWAWVLSSAVMGFLLSTYQIYAWSPFVGGAFSTLAATILVGFAVFAVVHVFLFYAGLRPAVALDTGK